MKQVINNLLSPTKEHSEIPEDVDEIEVEKPLKCTVCNDPPDKSLVYCNDCKDWLCEICVRAHLRVKVTRNHVINVSFT